MKSFSAQTHYEVLEISVGASGLEVQGAYERLVRLYSEDQVALYGLVEPERARALRERLKEALDVLADDTRRDSYDRSIGLPPRERPAGAEALAPPPAAPRPSGGWGAQVAYVSPPPPSKPEAPAPTFFTVNPPAAARPSAEARRPTVPVSSSPSSSAPVGTGSSAPVVASSSPVAATVPSAPVMPSSPAPASSAPAGAVVPASSAPGGPARPPSARATPTEARPAASPPPPASIFALPRMTAPNPVSRASPPRSGGEAAPAPAPMPEPPPDLVAVAPVPAQAPPAEVRTSAREADAPPPAGERAAEAPPLATGATSGPPGASASPSASSAVVAPAPPAEQGGSDAAKSNPEAAAPAPPEPAAPATPTSSPPAPASGSEETALAPTKPVKEFKPEPRPKPYEVPEGVEFNGDLLKQVRMARGQSLAQLSERTRISTRHLENVEADRYEQLPAAVYLRGILMSIARELGLDGLRVASSYLAFVEARRSKG